MKCHTMKRNFTITKNPVDPMPVYNRSHVQNRSKGGGDIALSTHKKQVFLEKEIKLDDTLQSVALEFNVSVAELKRVNNIHKENEIYARKVIKVPSNSLSLLLEKEYFTENNSALGKSQLPAQENCDVIVETVNNSSCVAKYSNDITTEEEGKYTYSPQPQDGTQESVALLNTLVEHKANDALSCSGADWGISWHVLLFVTLVLGVGGPVLYVLWFLWGRKGKDDGS